MANDDVAYVCWPAVPTMAQPRPGHLRAGGVLADEETHGAVPLQCRQLASQVPKDAGGEVGDDQRTLHAVIRRPDTAQHLRLLLQASRPLQCVHIEAQILQLAQRAPLRVHKARVGEEDERVALPRAAHRRRAVRHVAVKAVPCVAHVQLAHAIHLQLATLVVPEPDDHAVACVVGVHVAFGGIGLVELDAGEGEGGAARRARRIAQKGAQQAGQLRRGKRVIADLRPSAANQPQAERLDVALPLRHHATPRGVPRELHAAKHRQHHVRRDLRPAVQSAPTSLRRLAAHLDRWAPRLRLIRCSRLRPPVLRGFLPSFATL
mmetsp:Transcript_10652/g.27316  ORF Transcript_10652/g.27316 Transcript_10652/m.27316 type:complete len:320 (-) Transcript_10652:190-1149(-)